MTSEGKEFIDMSVSRETLVECIRTVSSGITGNPADGKTLEKLGFVFLRYNGFNMREACKTMGISIQTGYNWQNSWNENGQESVHPRYAGGRPSRLSPEDKAVLTEYATANLPSTRDVRAFINERFGFDYSEKQVHTIMKSLGFEHLSEKKLSVEFEKAPGDTGKALMRWVSPDSGHILSRN